MATVYKFRLISWLMGVMVSVFMSTAFATPTVESVIDDYIKATGGREAQADIKTYMRKGTFVIKDMSLQGELITYGQQGDYRQTITIPGVGLVEYGVQGPTVWQQHFLEGNSIINGFKARNVRRQSALNPWIDWQRYYSSAKYIGTVIGNHKLVFISKIEGDPNTIAYFDQETHLLNRIETMDENLQPSIYSFTDYREVKGITVAFHLSIKANMQVDMQFEAIEINEALPNDAFDIPEGIVSQMHPKTMPKKKVSAAMVLKGMDKNSDGKISMDEAPLELQGSFALIDANKDGGIDEQEADIIAQYINQ